MQPLKWHQSLHGCNCSRLKEAFSLWLKLLSKQHNRKWKKILFLQKESCRYENYCINWHGRTCSIIFHMKKILRWMHLKEKRSKKQNKEQLEKSKLEREIIRGVTVQLLLSLYLIWMREGAILRPLLSTQFISYLKE